MKLRSCLDEERSYSPTPPARTHSLHDITMTRGQTLYGSPRRLEFRKLEKDRQRASNHGIADDLGENPCSALQEQMAAAHDPPRPPGAKGFAKHNDHFERSLTKKRLSVLPLPPRLAFHPLNLTLLSRR